MPEAAPRPAALRRRTSSRTPPDAQHRRHRDRRRPAIRAADGLGPFLPLLGASLLAAGYTLALSRSGLTPLEAAALVSLASVAGMLPLQLLVSEAWLPAAGAGEILLQVAWQGVLSGLVAPLAFALAVARLGPGRAAAYAALSPAAAALWGVVLLAEVPGMVTVFALLAVSLGGVLAARR